MERKRPMPTNSRAKFIPTGQRNRYSTGCRDSLEVT